MFRFLMCCAVVAILLSPAVVQAEKPGKTIIAHIADVIVTEEPDVDPELGEGTLYTITGYYNVIEVGGKAADAHAGHAIEVMGVTFADKINWGGTEKHFTEFETVFVPDSVVE